VLTICDRKRLLANSIQLELDGSSLREFELVAHDVLGRFQIPLGWKRAESKEKTDSVWRSRMIELAMS
jgi:hypothetical protein